LAAPTRGVRAFFLAFLALAAPGLCAAGPSPLLPDDIRRSGAIIIATDAEYPPCESLAADNKTVVGFDPDLWTAIGQKLGVRITTVPTTFSGLISGVESGRYTLAMSCISDSVEREQRVLFVDYAFATSAIYTLASNKKISSDSLSLCGLKTAAEAGTDSVASLNLMSAHCVKNRRPPIAISQFPSANAMFNALVSNRVDFVLDDIASANLIRAQVPIGIRIVYSNLLPRLYTGMIVQKQARKLANALLFGLKAIQADGAYGRIMQTWRLASLQLNEPGFNLAAQRPLPAPQP
jgi:polar amino acid transport system substrate-binding protein